jgi:uncharacterized protein (TIGR03085 family)
LTLITRHGYKRYRVRRLIGVSTHTIAERTALHDTLAEVGPEAPTLCTGWDTRMLLAHLIVRERSLVEQATRMRFPRAAHAAERALKDFAATHSYAAMLAAFDRGAPFWSPFALPPAREIANLLEYAIHHEDVRRVDPSARPRPLSLARQHAMFKRLRWFAHATMKDAPVPVELRWEAHSIRVGRGSDRAVVTGDPLELALFAYGRQPVAVVEYSGDPVAVAAIRGAKLGVD